MWISDAHRRRLLVARQLALAGCTVVEATRRLVVLHATEAPSVYLSLLARVPQLSVDDVRTELELGNLVRLLAMRRTLFVVPRDVVPTVHAAASVGVAARLRARLLSQLASAPTDPPVTDPEGFLTAVEDGVLNALAESGPLDGSEVARVVPALRTAFLPTTAKKWDVRRTLTSPVLAMMSARGLIVRGQPAGSWTSNRYRWERADGRFAGGIPMVDEAESRVDLARAWLSVFGPATVADLAWWTGWNLGQSKAAVAALDTVPVSLAVGDGIALTTVDLDAPAVDDQVALLPALDPTTMGWKHREWYLGTYRTSVFDSIGNAGATVWVGGRIVGIWAVRKDGEVAYRLLEDVGADAQTAIEAEAARIMQLLDGTVFKAGFPTPLYRELWE